MSTRLNLAVRGLFATPVAALEVPDAGGDQRRAVGRHPGAARRAPSVQASNAGGWHSDREILDWGGPPSAD